MFALLSRREQSCRYGFFKSVQNPRKFTASFTASLKAWSSASVVEVALHVCRLAAHDIAPLPTLK